MKTELSEKEKLLIPAYRFRSVLDITPEDIGRMGAKAIGLDIDNTIVPDGRYKYLDGVTEWFTRMKQADVPVMIISNGNIIRVKIISAHYGHVPFIHMAKKPSPKGLLTAARRMNVAITELAMIGDQLTSDIRAANACGAIPVRVDPLEHSLYPHYYKYRAKTELPYLEYFEHDHGYGTENVRPTTE